MELTGSFVATRFKITVFAGLLSTRIEIVLGLLFLAII